MHINQIKKLWFDQLCSNLKRTFFKNLIVFFQQTSNISACCLGSAQTEKHAVMDGLMKGKYRVLYVTPEWCQDSNRDFLAELHKKIKITVVAIDEAHCVSQWGCDFRPDYRYVSKSLSFTLTLTERNQLYRYFFKSSYWF